MKNNPRPTLRGTSTYLRGSPGVERVRERSPLPPLIILHRHLFALAWANARDTGMRGKGSGNLSLERKLLIVFTPPAPSRGRRKAEGFVFTPTVPLKGEGEKEGFPQGFVEWRSIFLLVCLVMLRGKPLIVCLIGRLAKQALDCIHPACFCLSAENVSPSRGTRGLELVCRVLCRV